MKPVDFKNELKFEGELENEADLARKEVDKILQALKTRDRSDLNSDLESILNQKWYLIKFQTFCKCEIIDGRITKPRYVLAEVYDLKSPFE